MLDPNNIYSIDDLSKELEKIFGVKIYLYKEDFFEPALSYSKLLVRFRIRIDYFTDDELKHSYFSHIRPISIFNKSILHLPPETINIYPTCTKYVFKIHLDLNKFPQLKLYMLLGNENYSRN